MQAGAQRWLPVGRVEASSKARPVQILRGNGRWWRAARRGVAGNTSRRHSRSILPDASGTARHRPCSIPQAMVAHQGRYTTYKTGRPGALQCHPASSSPLVLPGVHASSDGVLSSFRAHCMPSNHGSVNACVDARTAALGNARRCNNENARWPMPWKQWLLSRWAAGTGGKKGEEICYMTGRPVGASSTSSSRGLQCEKTGVLGVAHTTRRRGGRFVMQHSQLSVVRGAVARAPAGSRRHFVSPCLT